MSDRGQLWSGMSGLVRWVAVFLAGFVIGYGMMSAVIDDPVAGELPPTSAVFPTQAPGALTPTELPPLEVAEEAAPTSARLAPGTEAQQLPVTQLQPEVIETAQAAPEIPRPWWEACQGRRCRLDFGGISGNLTIRKATLVHGSTINWAADMAARPRIESLPTERPLDVRVEAIAMAPDGTPAAAEIVWSRKGRAIRGVITLDLGEPGKRVVMHP